MIQKIIVIYLVLFLSPMLMADDLLDLLGNQSEADIVVSQEEFPEEIRRLLSGKTTPEQNIFLNFLQNKKYSQALYQWEAAFSKTAFGKTDNGVAIYALLLQRNNLPIVALETLFSIKNPKNISIKLREFWTASMAVESSSWKYANINWSNGWTDFFSPSIEVKVASFNATKISNSEKILELLKKPHLKEEQINWLQWQLALRFSEEGQVKKSAKVLAFLLKNNKGQVGEDLLNITIARLLYGQGYLKVAIEYYLKVDKSSNYWFAAQEEIGWAHIRMGRPQDTLAVTKGLMLDDLSHFIQAETLMLRSFAQLKVCDYYGSVQTVNEFAKRFRNKVKSLQDLSQSPNNPATQKLISNLEKNRIHWSEMGSEIQALPQFTMNDEVLFHQAQVLKSLKLEGKLIEDLYGASVSGGSSNIGYQASILELKKSIDRKINASNSALFSRIQLLANEEIQEIKEILNKMQIVEAEVIQQVAVANKALSTKIKNINLQEGTTGSKNKFALKFPFEGEIWMDELAAYKVDLNNSCQVKR